MELNTLIILALGLAADAFAVSLSSGLLIKNFKINKALKIALFFGGFQYLMPLIGWVGGLFFRDLLVNINHWIAFILLSLIGGKMIYESLAAEDEEERFNPIDTYTLFGLAIATSIDSLAVGFSLSVIQTSILQAATIIGVITFILSFMGVFIGHTFGGVFKEKAELLGGLVLVAIGAKILLEHLGFI
jgi:putative Mn2+ efflux pump MntP